MHALRGGEPHGVAGLRAEGLVEAVRVPEDDVDPLLGGGVGVRAQLLGEVLRAHLAGEAEGVGQEEALERRLPVDLTPGAVGLGPHERVEGQFDTAEVGDVLAEREAAVHVDAGERFLAVIAGDEFLAAGPEGRLGRGRPAFLEPAGRAVMPPGIVKAVGDLVADRRGDVAVEHRVIEGLPGVPGGGEDGGRQDDFVVQRVVVGVHGVRAHAPFLVFRRPADAGELAAHGPAMDGRQVIGQPTRADRDPFVETPFIRVADPGLHGRQLACGPLPRGGVHPRVGAQAFREDGPHVLGHAAEAVALRRAEMPGHVLAPDQVTDGPILDF